MKAKILALGLLLGATAAGLSFAGYTDTLDPLRNAVFARRGATDTSTRSGRKDANALGRVGEILTLPAATVGEDLGLAKRAAKKLHGRFAGDAAFEPLLDTALDDLEALAAEQRDGLARWTGRLGSNGRERRLDRAIGGFDSLRAKAAEATTAKVRARKLHVGCRRLDRVEQRLGIEPLPPPPTGAGMVPDFLLTDVNPSSATAGQTVSPRDYVGKISAWYFGHST